jgi:hypothetical protein
VVGGDPSRCGVRRLLAFLHGRPASAPCRRVATLVPAAPVLPRTRGEVAPARGVPGRAGRTVAALDATLDDLTFSLSPALDSPLAGPGLRGGSFRLRRGGIVLHRLQVVRGVRVSGVLPRRGSARLQVSGSAAAAGRLRVSPRGSVRGRLGGKRVRGRLRAGPPRPVAAVAKSAQFRHIRAFRSVRPRPYIARPTAPIAVVTQLLTRSTPP